LDGIDDILIEMNNVNGRYHGTEMKLIRLNDGLFLSFSFSLSFSLSLSKIKKKDIEALLMEE